MFTLICPWTNSWSNNEDASDLRHHRAHYDVTVMDDRRHNQMHSDKQHGSWTKWPILCCRLLKWDPFNRIFCIFTKISLRFVRRCAIENTCKSRCVKIEIQIEDFFIYTVYPTKYAHGFVVLCFVVVMQSFIMNSREVFIHIHQGCFAGTGAIVRLPQCQWSKPDGYGKISQCITTTKHSKAKTACIFLGIYCSPGDKQLTEQLVKQSVGAYMHK